MSKHNLLGGRYSVPPTSPPSPPLLQRGQVLLQKELLPLPLQGRLHLQEESPHLQPGRLHLQQEDLHHLHQKESGQIFHFKCCSSKEQQNSHKHRLHAPRKKAPETNEQEASVSQNDLGEAMGRFAGQRRMAERLKDPIVVKTKDEFECIQIKIPHPKKESQCPSNGGGH